MNWDDLRFFLALSREGSVSGAGRALGVKHTTVARRVRALEEQLGTRLFDRQRQGYAMTQAAENLYQHALVMEAQAQAVDREIFGRDAELKGPLKLTAAHDLASLLILPSLAEFAANYPGIDLELLTSKGLMDLAAREADIAVRLTSQPPDYLVGRSVMPLRHGVYGAPEYLQAKTDQTRVILFRGDSGLPEWVAENYPDAAVGLRVDDATAMLVAVKNRLGLARLPCFIADSDPAVRRVDVPLTPSTWSVWILSHVDLRSTARVRVCRDFLNQTLEEQRPLILGEKSSYFEAG